MVQLDISVIMDQLVRSVLLDQLEDRVLPAPLARLDRRAISVFRDVQGSMVHQVNRGVMVKEERRAIAVPVVHQALSNTTPSFPIS